MYHSVLILQKSLLALFYSCRHKRKVPSLVTHESAKFVLAFDPSPGGRGTIWQSIPQSNLSVLRVSNRRHYVLFSCLTQPWDQTNNLSVSRLTLFQLTWSSVKVVSSRVRLEACHRTGQLKCHGTVLYFYRSFTSNTLIHQFTLFIV